MAVGRVAVMLGREALIEAAKKLWGEPTEVKPNEMRFGSHGSKSIKLAELVWYDHELEVGGGVVDLCAQAGIAGNGADSAEPWITYDYRDEHEGLLFQVVRKPGHRFLQRRPNGGDWIWSLGDVQRVPYRLPQLIAAETDALVYVCEGEKDVDNIRALGLVATCNPGGAGKWREAYSVFLADRDVVILPDNDEPGREHAAMVERLTKAYAKSVIVVPLPDLADKEDVSDWIARGGTAVQLRELVEQTKKKKKPQEELPEAVTFDDFLYSCDDNKFIYRKTGSLWVADAVNARLPWTGGVKPSKAIARDHAVEQMTWFPGEPTLIKNKLILQGGWVDSPAATVFNLYRAPHIKRGHAGDAEPWVEHVRYVYPDDASHIIKWLAHRCQHPGVKINHALLLGGGFGIGKDTLLEPVKNAVGHWNVSTVSPSQMLDTFNPHVKSVLLVVNEARDLGDANRPQFYEHLKSIIAAPPNVILVNDKYTHHFYIPNLTGVIITTNHKASGIYLAYEDRRHYVAWSPLEVKDFEPDYFDRLWEFYDHGGLDDVAAYLMELDLSDFNPKAQPKKTAAFDEIVMSSTNPEVGELDDIVEKMGRPWTLTLDELIRQGTSVDDPDGRGDRHSMGEHLRDRRNRRMVPRWLEQVGYVTIRNPDSRQGLWHVDGKKQVIYGNKDRSGKELMEAAWRRAQGRT